MFHFKQFSLSDDKSAMKVGTDAVLLGAWADVGLVQSILDVGTGSGLIALMMAQRSTAKIDAVEIDDASAELAKSNFSISPWSGRLQVHVSAFQHFAEVQNSSYDLIISNPPYFSNSLKSPDPGRCIARHDDLLPANEFMHSADKLLSADGKVAVIIPSEARQNWIMEASRINLFPARILSIVPRQGKPTNRVILEFSRKGSQSLQEETIEIRDSRGNYTESYQRLTSEFYLGF